MQESLSQFMCHACTTTERHYRHHMPHRSLWPVFNELARCQALPSENTVVRQALLSGDTVITVPLLDCDLSLENTSISHNSTDHPLCPTKNHYVYICGLDNEDLQILSLKMNLKLL